MPLNTNADYDQIVVTFNPETLGIRHIKARNSGTGGEEGTLDRFSLDAMNQARPGIYNPEDPDISKVVQEIVDRRADLNLNTTDGVTLIYQFGTNNAVDATRMDPSTDPRYAYFMFVDPIHTEVRRREGNDLFTGVITESAESCIRGVLRVKQSKDES